MARRAPRIELTAQERTTLQSIVRSSTAAQRDVLRARVVLLAAEGRQKGEIQENLDVAKPVGVKWRRRFAVERMDGFFFQAEDGIRDIANVASNVASNDPDRKSFENLAPIFGF